MLLTLLATYWWVVGIAGVVAAYFVLRKFAKSHVKSFVESYLKTFDASAFAAGQVALPAVIDDTYAAMPVFVKSLVSKTVFAAIVELAFNEVKKLAASEASNVDKPEVAATSTPSTAPVAVESKPVDATASTASATESTPAASESVSPVATVSPASTDASTTK